VGVGTAAGALAALRSGQIDAICNTDPVMTMLEQKGDVKIISDTRTLKGTQEVFGGPMPAGCLYAPHRVRAEEPQHLPGPGQCHRARRSSGCRRPGPSDIIKTVPEAYLLGDRALYLASFNKVREAISLDGMIPRKGADGAEGAGQLRPAIKADKIDLARPTPTNSPAAPSLGSNEIRAMSEFALELTISRSPSVRGEDPGQRYTAVSRHHAAHRAGRVRVGGRAHRLRQVHPAERWRRAAGGFVGRGPGVWRAADKASTAAPATCSRPRR
jgi:hypothetical protein